MNETLILNFGINSEYDLYEKLKRDLEKILSGNHDTTATIDNTFNYLITAYHLSYDWTKDDKYSKKKESLPETFNNLLTAIKFLANCSKHKELKNRLSENTVEEVTEPTVGNYYDYVYGDQILITINGKQESLSLLSEPLMVYFEWLLDDSKNIEDIPLKVKNFT